MTTRVSRLERLRRVSPFPLLTACQAALVVDAVVKRRYKKGEFVVKQGKSSLWR